MNTILARTMVDERMDDPHLPAADHAAALRGLRRINAFSSTARQISRPILSLARKENMKRISLMDIACGGADVPVRVARILQDAGIAVDLTLLDCSETALAIAAENAKSAGVTCTTRAADLCGNWNDAIFDVVTCSLFLHHLPSGNTVCDVLRKMKAITCRMVVVSDLVRSRRAWLVAWVGGRVLSRSPIVHFDAPVSVRAAWTIDELHAFASAAGMSGATIEKSFPYRMLLQWNNPDGNDR